MSALDKQLAPYRARPHDESGSFKRKVSLIFDQREASFIDKDTFYQIGYQGFASLSAMEPRLAQFSKSIFEYSNTQIDPLFLTADENKHVLTFVEHLLYLLSDYVMETATVQILEYLIQQFAVNRMRPAHLVLIVLPYLETSLFVRIMQTIPFKTLPHEFKFVRMFSSVATTKKPLTRAVLREWIVAKPAMLQWIIGAAPEIAAIHPGGVFASFVGVLFAELSKLGTPEVAKSVVSFAKAIFTMDATLDGGVLAPNMLMALTVAHERQPLNAKLVDFVTNALFEFKGDEHFKAVFMAAAYFAESAEVLPGREFVIKLGSNVPEVDRLSKKLSMTAIAKKVVKSVMMNLEDVDVVRAATVVVMTSFFDSVAESFVSELVHGFVDNEYTQQLLSGLTRKYQAAVTVDVVDTLKKIGVTMTPHEMSASSLLSQLSNPSRSAALFSDRSLPFNIAASQAVAALKAACAGDEVECIMPILTFFEGRAPQDLVEYLTNNMFMNNTKFSRQLNKELRAHGAGICSWMTKLPDSNQAILDQLVACDLTDSPRLFPLVLAKAIKSGDPLEVCSFLEVANMDFDKVLSMSREFTKSGDFVMGEPEAQTALILSTILKISETQELTVELIGKLLDFPDIRCVAAILKSEGSHEKVAAAFEMCPPEARRLPINALYYVTAVMMNMKDATSLLPVVLMALTYPYAVDQAMMTMQQFPMKQKDVKTVLSRLLRQEASFKVDEEALRNVFVSLCKNPKNRDFFDGMWSHIQTSQGCARFWKLTHDSGVATAIQKFSKDANIAATLSDVLECAPEPHVLCDWALKSLNSHIIRAAIPYMTFKDLSMILYPVCAYPRFYAEAFKDYFLKHEIDGKDLVKTLKVTQGNPEKGDVGTVPPLIFPVTLSKLKPKALISPSMLILELLPLSKNVKDIDALVPTLFTLLRQRKCHNLIFACLSLCLDKSSKYIVDHFGAIIDAISESPVAHVHATALRLMSVLTKKYPEVVAEHAIRLFTTLDSPTLFSDDSANLTKIKQILSTVLPILSKNGRVDVLFAYFAVNLEICSVDRACQLMVHSIRVLGGDSFKVFLTLLSHGKTDFCLLLIDQLSPDELITALINLARTDAEIVDFITQIQLPPLPRKLIELFVVLDAKMEVDAYFEQTCNSFGLIDFIEFMKELIPTEFPVHEIIHDRIESEPSSAFASLLPILEAKIKGRDALANTFTMVRDIVVILTTEDAHGLVSLIKTIMDGVVDDRYTVVIRVQALCLMSTIIERFEITVLEVFPRVVAFASELYTLLVNSAVEAVIPSVTAAVCLLLKTSPRFCVSKMPELWSALLSPNVYYREDQEALTDLVKRTLMTTAESVEIEALLKPFIVAHKAHTSHPVSLVLLFKAFSRALKGNAEYTRASHKRIMTFFLIAFDTQCADWDDTIQVQGSIIHAFTTFVSQLSEELLPVDLARFDEMFSQTVQSDRSGHVVNRVFFVRTLIKLVNGIGKSLTANYSRWWPVALEFLGETNDANDDERYLTCKCLELVRTMAEISQAFFDQDQFVPALPIIVRHASVVVEAPEQFMEKIIESLAPAFAALINAAKDESLRRMADNAMIELMHGENPFVRIAGLKIVEESFHVVKGALTPILPDLVPSLYELLEDPNQSVQQVVRQTKDSISSSIGESVDSYFR